jgi:hypothetical protein
MTTSNETIRQLLIELGQGSDTIDGIQETGDGEWAMLVDETRRFDLDHDAARGVLVVGTDVGRPAEGREREAYEALLSYNALWAQTGGARMALGGTGGDVLLLTWGRLDAVLANLREVADAWRELLAGSDAPPQAGQPAWPGQLA